MKILVSAAETSSDIHGAVLVRALRDQLAARGEKAEFFGMGGPKLQAEGLRAQVDARELLAMGFGEILGRLPRIFSALDELERAAAEERPDVAVVLDYPDFHFRLAKRLRRLGIPVVYYIPPKVWVWRKTRLRILKDRFARILCILPFEREFYEREKVPAVYVGNPLADELPLSLSRAQARIRLGLGENERVLVVMPGSRPSELRNHLELFLDAATEAAALMRRSGFLASDKRLRVLVPFPSTSDPDAMTARIDRWLARYTTKPAGFILRVTPSHGDAPICLRAADAGLIKSGTSTLEAAVMGCPHLIAYQTNFLTRWIFKFLVRYGGPIGLSNLVADERGYGARRPFPFSEFLGNEATRAALAAEIASLFTDEARRTTQREVLGRVRQAVAPSGVGAGEGPSAFAAREILAVAKAQPSR